MRRTLSYIVIILALIGCSPSTYSTREIHNKQQSADKQIAEIEAQIIGHQDLDTIHAIATRTEGVYFFLFHNNKLIYWSNNRLNIDGIDFASENEWKEEKLKNATILLKQKSIGNLLLMAAIPIKWDSIDEQTLANSFSYQPLMENQEKEKAFWESAYLRTHIFYFSTILLFLLSITSLIFALVRAGSFKNLPLQHKITCIFLSMTMICLFYIFSMSIRYTNRHYTLQQNKALQNKAAYIQNALQTLYYWDYELTDNKIQALNADLRDLAHTYQTDIHIYNTNGYILASSTPQLFEQGLLAPYIAPDVLLEGGKGGEDNPLDKEWTQTEYINKKAYLASYTTFKNGSGMVLGVIDVPSFLSKDEMAQERDNFIMRLLPAYLIALFLALLLSIYSARILTSPLAKLKRNMQQYRLGTQTTHIDYPYHDEIGELVAQYNALLEQVANSSQLLAQAEKESAWRTMARQVAHEINNTLTPMKLTLQQLQRTKSTDRFDTYFEKSTTILIEQIDNLSHIATSFATIAKMPIVKQEKVNIAEKITNIITLHEQNEQHIPIRYIGPNDGIYALTDNEQIQQVLTNILRNALQALKNKQDGDIIVSLKEEKQKIHISISDNGEGISPDVQDKIFTPNFTTKAYGTGMGLAIAKHIVKSCGGEIWFQTSPNGTTFHISLQPYFL